MQSSAMAGHLTPHDLRVEALSTSRPSTSIDRQSLTSGEGEITQGRTPMDGEENMCRATKL
ncbi:hypothetical protein C0Q70_01211 [Pomacea canaliculata]|uniref:Uncharacterized protein n=1 Tax=Pomacea canaliculata TaxID=400727 RepID=A0A2T7PYU1_POMCA|nr:hypothetical protein C0Q70_01211 [Pomacea canaliculata]